MPRLRIIDKHSGMYEHVPMTRAVRCTSLRGRTKRRLSVLRTGLTVGLAVAMVLVALPVTLGGSARNAAVASPGVATRCDERPVFEEPPCNPYLADSPWAGTHRNPYRQSSSPLTTRVDGRLRAEHLDLPGVPIWAHVSEPYPDGRRVIWASLAGSNMVVKIDERTFTLIDRAVASAPSTGLGGAYYELNRANELVRLGERHIEAWGDVDGYDSQSPIELVQRFEVPEGFFCRDETLVGIGHTYDGWLVFATELGNFGVLPADPTEWSSDAMRRFSINGPACADDSVATEDLEHLTNNFAIDEHGGIYPVTSEAMYRLKWDDRRLVMGWRTTYRSSDQPGAAEVGSGSGATPTLMGTTPGDDRLVVITDGQDLRHFVAFWRDKIPADWRPIAPGRDRRIACETPVNFGDPSRTRTATEQSVTVAGYSGIVVDNLLKDESAYEGLPRASRVVVAGLSGGDPAKAPRGVARVDWDPDTRTCRTTWANPEVSFPNGIPLVARGSGLVVANSLGRDDEGRAVFGARALDFRTGKNVWFVPGVRQSCADVALAPAGRAPQLEQDSHPLLPELGNACENGFYSQMGIGPGEMLYSGTFGGMSRWVPDGDASQSTG